MPLSDTTLAVHVADRRLRRSPNARVTAVQGGRRVPRRRSPTAPATSRCRVPPGQRSAPSALTVTGVRLPAVPGQRHRRPPRRPPVAGRRHAADRRRRVRRHDRQRQRHAGTPARPIDLRVPLRNNGGTDRDQPCRPRSRTTDGTGHDRWRRASATAPWRPARRSTPAGAFRMSLPYTRRRTSARSRSSSPRWTARPTTCSADAPAHRARARAAPLRPHDRRDARRQRQRTARSRRDA